VEHETVAVETTASFVKTFQIPQGIDSGIYVAHASIVYPDQITPATTQFSFTVEQRYLGLFEDDFITYGGFTIIVGLLMGILGHIFVRRVRASRFKPISYSDIPKDDRVFYELISDTILGMHEKVGDVAFDIAGNIPGMKIDKDFLKRVRKLNINFAGEGGEYESLVLSCPLFKKKIKIKKAKIKMEKGYIGQYIIEDAALV